jgi:hypothetical protein
MKVTTTVLNLSAYNGLRHTISPLKRTLKRMHKSNSHMFQIPHPFTPGGVRAGKAVFTIRLSRHCKASVVVLISGQK